MRSVKGSMRTVTGSACEHSLDMVVDGHRAFMAVKSPWTIDSLQPSNDIARYNHHDTDTGHRVSHHALHMPRTRDDRFFESVPIIFGTVPHPENHCSSAIVAIASD